MDSKPTDLSAVLLHAVLDGMTYESVARRHGLTRTAVERRVKLLVRRLIGEIGVEGLNQSQALYAKNLRLHRVAIMAALAVERPVERFGAGGPEEPKVLSAQDIELAMRRTRMHTQTPERDVAMVMILLATGLRPLEVARLCIEDYLRPDGSVRGESVLSAEVAVNRRARPVFFLSAAACDAIDAYLLARQPGTGTGTGTARPGRTDTTPDGRRPYRGFAPRDALFLSAQGRAFHVESIATAQGGRSLCREIHYAYRKIFHRIGHTGLSALSIRHTVIHRLAMRGADGGQIAELLGIRELRQMPRARLPLSELMRELV